MSQGCQLDKGQYNTRVGHNVFKNRNIYGFDHSRKKKIVDKKIALQITSSSLCALYAVGCTFYYFELNVVL